MTTSRFVLTLAVLGACHIVWADSPPVTRHSVARGPIPLTSALNAPGGFERLKPWPPSLLIRGGKVQAARALFAGDVTVALYKSSAGLARLTDQPYDELVYVVRGEAILTANGQSPQHFLAGDFFLVPRGFTGTWEVKRNYRELMVVETKSLNRAEKYFFKGLPDPQAASR